MKGTIRFRKDRGYFVVVWYHAPEQKNYHIYRYNGELMLHRRYAEKLLACMQADVENGCFRIEKYTTETPTDVIPYMREWLETVSDTLKPATQHEYKNSIERHLVPFFQEHPIQLHEIRYDTLLKLTRSIQRAGKGKMNVMYCLHRCLDFAWRSGRIVAVPPFPERKQYGIKDPEIKWLPEERQIAIINAIPQEHQPIFWWLKFHLRRPSEACALHKVDYNPMDGGVFVIRRTFSRKMLVNSTKTGKIHIIPCHDEFKPIMEYMLNEQKQWGIVSPYFFVNPTGHKPGRHYTNVMLNNLWKVACRVAGESIDLYSGTKHSSCSQYINEKGLSMSDLQAITDHARLDSVKRYAKMEVQRKRDLMNSKVISIRENSIRKSDKNKKRPKGSTG